MTAGPMPAILDQLAAHAAQLAGLAAAREDDAARLASLTALTAGLHARAGALTSRLDDLACADDGADQPGDPAPSRRWHQLAGPDRDHAIAVLREWVEEVFRPGYGHLAAGLGPCWDRHGLCLHALDILAGLWHVLYAPGRRTPGTLTAQAEYQARILPVLVAQAAAETTRCHGRHAPARPRTAP